MASNKGPAGAVIREVSIDEAFAEDGEAPAILTGEDRNAGRAIPVRGISLVSPGGKDVETVPDARVVANNAIRRARSAGTQTGHKPPPGQRIIQAPADAREDWEIAAGVGEPAPAVATAAAAGVVAQPERTASLGAPVASGDDMLTRAKKRAFKALAVLPTGFELFAGTGVTAEGIEVIMGLGYLVGTGLAVYRGDGHYRLSANGRVLADQGDIS